MNLFSFTVQTNCTISKRLKLGFALTEIDLRWQRASQRLRSECLWVCMATDT